MKLTVRRYCSAVKPISAFKNFLRKGRWIAFVLLMMMFKFSASSQTYLPLYTQTNSFEQYTSFISTLLGAKQGNVFVEEETKQVNWVGGKVLAPGISCPTISSPICLSSGTTFTQTTNAWNPTITPDVGCATPNPTTSAYASTGFVTPATGTTLNGAVFGVGNSTVTWTVTDGCGNTATCSFSVTVYGVPSSALSAGVINGGTPISACVGFTAAAMDIGSPAPSGGTPPYSYQWQLNGSNIGGATSATYSPPSFASPGNYDYTAIVTDACGRTATTPIKKIYNCSRPFSFNFRGRPSLSKWSFSNNICDSYQWYWDNAISMAIKYHRFGWIIY